MKRIIILLAMSVMFIILSGCASIFHGTTQTIHVRSEEPETKLYLNDVELGITGSQKGTYAVTSIPKKDLKKAVLKATKQDCAPVLSKIETRFDGISLLGILLDYGLISILVVDWAITGAVTEAARTDYVLTPNCSPGNTGTPTWINIEKKEPVKEEKSGVSTGSETGWGAK